MAVGPARDTARVRTLDPLRENFFKLLRRSYLIAEKNGGGGLAVYRSCAEMIHRLCGEPWARSTIFPGETALVRRFLAETGLPARNPDAVVQHSLMGNSWPPTWTAILLNLPRGKFESVCSVRGAENLRSARAAGRGIVLTHSHSLFSQMFWAWLEHEGIAPGVTLWQWTWGRKRKEVKDPRVMALEGARELHGARKALRDGGLVHVMADGQWGGAQQIVLPLWNRQRPFRPAFAELALGANAQVIPVDVSLAADGGIAIEIGSPFGDQPAGRDLAQRVEGLVREYVEHLSRRWREHPADIPWFQMKRHLAYPPAAS
ncbi:MAG: hypothetical protein HYU77_04125 [Betaproteobacteria bacterium]|nr:hypothetical protein [Betaproteobacteria bacterium]